jgi:uncharacterized protein (TIGR02996 family)
MGSEEQAFRAALDATPEDETARLVFADWLQEQGRDEDAASQRAMAPGYRVLLACKAMPQQADVNPGDWWWNRALDGYSLGKSYLPSDWFNILAGDKAGDGMFPPYKYPPETTCEELMDAAAIAFSKLPAERQAELLASEVLR